MIGRLLITAARAAALIVLYPLRKRAADPRPGYVPPSVLMRAGGQATSGFKSPSDPGGTPCP